MAFVVTFTLSDEDDYMRDSTCNANTLYSFDLQPSVAR
jgi:hypothetical protein